MMKLEVWMPLASTLFLLLISMSSPDMKAGEKAKIRTGFNDAQKVFTIMSELNGKDKVGIYKSLGKMAGFLGAAGGLISIALLFLPQEESAELKALKKGFAEVNMKLDVITTELDNIKDLIKLENQKAVYSSAAAKIIYGHKKLQEFLDEMAKTACSNENQCKRAKARIALRYVRYFDVQKYFHQIVQGATKKASEFGEPQLHLVKTTSHCHIPKIERLSNGILKLSFKAQQVILAHERLTGTKTSITNSIYTWLKSMYQLRDGTETVKQACFKNMKTRMIKEINNKKYQVGFSSNNASAIKLKEFVDDKYPWLGWIVYSYGAYGASKHNFYNVNGLFLNSPKEQNERKRNIIVSFTDKRGKYSNGRHKVSLAIEDIKEKVNFHSANNDAYKMLPVFLKEFGKRDVMKYINSIGLLREYDSYTITADNELTYIDEVHLFTSRERSKSYLDSRRPGYGSSYHTTKDKVRVVITLKSEEQVSGIKCNLKCGSHGRCKEMPFSSAKYCQCEHFYQGQKCEDKVKANLAKTMDAMLTKTLKLPMLSDIAYDIKDMREYVGVGFVALQTAVSELEDKFQRAYEKISHQLTSQFEWANLLTLYSSSLQNIKQYALRFESLPKRYSDIMEEEGRKLATAVLAPNGIERWLTDVNFLLIGRSGVPLLKHKPMLILFMNKYKNQVCLDSYKNAVKSAWKQLVLLQTIGFMVWAQALEFNDKGPHRIVNLYKRRINLQKAKFESTTCEYQVANSENIQCAGGGYLHPGLTIKNKCKPNYYATGELTTNCLKRGATCRKCGCNSRGSRSPQCSDTTGKCQCQNGFKGTKCNNRDCEWGAWLNWSGCSKACDYGKSSQTRGHRRTQEGQGKTCTGSDTRFKTCFHRCCSNQFHCSNRKKCIPYSYKCDYDNDCGDNQDEHSCQEQCTTKYTAWNYHGEGNSIFFDRHKLDCGGQGHVLKMFHLEARTSQMRYKYKCCKLNKATMCAPTSHSTGFTYDGKGDTFFLDRQTLDCGKNSYLNGFWLRRSGSNLKYDVKCCELQFKRYRERTHCETANTRSTDGGNGKNFFLDRQTVECPGRRFLSHFKLERNGPKLWYKYTCCEVRS